MRYIQLDVSEAEVEKIQNRKESIAKAESLEGDLDLLTRLLQLSPACTSMADITRLVRVNMIFDQYRTQVNPLVELAEDDYTWVKSMLNHTKYDSYGPALKLDIGRILLRIEEARTQKEAPKLEVIK